VCHTHHDPGWLKNLFSELSWHPQRPSCAPLPSIGHVLLLFHLVKHRPCMFMLHMYLTCRRQLGRTYQLCSMSWMASYTDSWPTVTGATSTAKSRLSSSGGQYAVLNQAAPQCYHLEIIMAMLVCGGPFVVCALRYDLQEAETQERVQQLVKSGQLAFANGGWVSNDEAIT
jgi:hypothetical protein